MTQFQHLASSTGKSAVNRPVSKLLTHVSLWTVHAVELRSQQIERPAWPHAGQQMVSHCYLEGCTKPYIHSNSRQSAYTPAVANIWRRWHCWEQKYPTITKNSSTNKRCSAPGLQRNSNISPHHAWCSQVLWKLQHWHNYNRADPLQYQQELWKKYSADPDHSTTNCIIMRRTAADRE